MNSCLPFTKMHGLGNCYIYINGFENHLSEKILPELARDIACVSTGIGSDGLILIGPSEIASVKMRVFNRDGSEARNCGNGLRCVAKYAYEHQLISGKIVDIETLSGIVRAQVHVSDGIVDEVTVNMGKPKWRPRDLPMIGKVDEELIHEPIEVNGVLAVMTGVSIGNPHGVFFVDAVDKAPVETFGSILADDHPLFPEGLNVEFVEMVSANEMHFRVWERGSGITQACGTGACAAVVAAVLNGKAKHDQEVIVHVSGGDLKITWQSEGSVLMTGSAITVCEGTYFSALAL